MSENKPPSISVVMPARNVERWIAAAVESVLSSSVQDIELLASDDGSTDGTRRILESFASKDARVRLIDTHATGPATARNKLLAMARGRFIAFQDSDDICHPERLRLQREFLERNADFSGVSCNLVLITEELVFPTDTDKHEKLLRVPEVKIDPDRVFGRVVDYSFGASMIRMESLQKIGNLRPFFTGNEVVDFNLRLAEIGKLANLQELLYAYRKHAMNVAKRWPYTNLESGVLLRMFAARRRKGLPDTVYERKPNFIRIFTSGLAPLEIVMCLAEVARLSVKRSGRIAKAVLNRHWK